MSSLIQHPDTISFARNLKKFIVSSAAEVSFRLSMGAVIILEENYQPDGNGRVEIDLRSVVDDLLSIALPSAGSGATEQTTGIADFSAVIDGTVILFRAIKGGVKNLSDTTEAWTNAHWLTWQLQDKQTLQYQPEWMGVYANAERIVKAKAKFADNSYETVTLYTLEAGKLYTADVSWSAVNTALTTKNPISWEVWFEDNTGTRLSYIQRYTLRELNENENIFLWVNTLGGIDSISFLGYAEDDRGLEHLVSEHYDGSFTEDDIQENREIKQSTGYLTRAKSRWVVDFFFSRNRYRVLFDGTVKSIVFNSSDTKWTTQDDLISYEFTYQYGSDEMLLNLETIQEQLQDSELPDHFFLTELLISLPSAQYDTTLQIAVQSPFAIGWQRMSIGTLIQNALQENIDNQSIKYLGGKLMASSVPAMTPDLLDQLKDWIKDQLPAMTGDGQATDSDTVWIDGDVLWMGGMDFKSTVINYKMLGRKMSASPRDFTLDDAEPALDRIDVFYVDTFGQVGVKKGTAGADPAAPQLSTSQLLIRAYLIKAGATEPYGMRSELIYDENAAGEWAHTETHDEHVSVNFDSTEEPADGSKCMRVEIDVPDTVISAPKHYIGEKYQGGVIFWIDQTGKKGKIAAINDQASNVFWSALSGFDTYTTGATGSGMGTGKENTRLMLLNMAAAGQAVRYCDQLVIDGYDDWYMPSEMELMEMYRKRYEIGNFQNKTYWSSTEISWDKARCIVFDFGTPYTRLKNNHTDYFVRAIRDFDDDTLEANVAVLTYAPENTKWNFAADEEMAVADGTLVMKMRFLSLSGEETSVDDFGGLLLELFLGAVKTGQTLLAGTNLFGFKPGDNAWQMVAVPLEVFGSLKPSFDYLQVTMSGNWKNSTALGMEKVRIVWQKKEATVQKKYVDIPVTSSLNPSIENYQKLYATKYGEYPTVRLFTVNAAGNRILRSSDPEYILGADGKVSRIEFSPGEQVTGVIVLSV